LIVEFNFGLNCLGLAVEFASGLKISKKEKESNKKGEGFTFNF